MERGEIALEEQFLLSSTIFCYMMLESYVKTRIRFSLQDKRLFEITRVNFFPFKDNGIKLRNMELFHCLGFKVYGYTSTFSVMFFKGRQFLGLLVFLPGRQSLHKMRSTLKGKNFSKGSKFFHLWDDPNLQWKWVASPVSVPIYLNGPLRQHFSWLVGWLFWV